ncbi:MAG TPA: hypothetical protein VI942_12265, partial [Thermoanaerobaculia bacterium]|nr:hypothetical protein [Thermoanaerobaculia bacterium]
RRERAEGDATFDEIVSVDAGSGQERILFRRPARDATRLIGALWSPDGRRIATVLTGNQAGLPDRIGVLDVASGELAERALDLPGLGGIKIFGVDWVSNERLVLLLRDDWQTITSAGRVALFDVAARTTRSLLPIQPVRGGIAYAGRGSVIVGLGSEEQSLSELTVSAEGAWSATRQLTEGPFFDRQPVYSPDGRWIVFTSNRSGNLDLWRLARDSGELQRLTDHAAEDWDPALSADGKRLVFSSNRTGRFQIWIAEADGSSPRQVTDIENAQNPTMTPDGEWIVFVRQNAGPEANGIWRIRPDGRDAAPLALGPMFVPETSPDGKFVAYVNTLTGGGIARLDSGPPTKVEVPGVTRLRWSTEGTAMHLWCIVATDQGSSVRRFPFDPVRGELGAGTTVLSEDPAHDLETLGVARDGSAVTVSRQASARTQIVRIDGLEGLQE